MLTKVEVEEKIIEYSKELRLPAIRRDFIEIAKEASLESLGYENYLFKLLESEFQIRKENRKKSAIRQACFPFKKYLDELETSELPKPAQDKLNTLKRLDFIDTGQNVILTGNPGTGKTHLAIALGIKACLEDKKVFFTTTSSLITQIRETRSEKKLRQLESKFEKYDLVIIDEFGYISFDNAAAELLFTHLSLRAGRKATIITTNLTFDRWKEIFGDPVLTAAMVDRLTHKAYMVEMNGTSYRMKETQKWLDNQYKKE